MIITWMVKIWRGLSRMMAKHEETYNVLSTMVPVGYQYKRCSGAAAITMKAGFFALILLFAPCDAFSTPPSQRKSYWTSPAANEETPPSILAKIQQSPWRGGLEPAVDVPSPVECQVVQGCVPTDLRGTLFRNGPGRIRIGECIYGHWFDGDGYVVKLTFDTKAVLFQGGYVKTDRFKAEMGNDGKDGTRVRLAWTNARNGNFFSNLFQKPTNPSNTACQLVTTKQGKRALLALAEGGPPCLMDPTTLETLGDYDYEAPAEFSQVNSMASAHPATCPETGQMFTCGLRLVEPSAWPSLTQLKVYKFAPSANDSLELQQTATIDMPTISFVHDLAISEKHVCLFLQPYETERDEMFKSMISGPPLGKRFSWNEKRGTRIIVLNRKDLSVASDVTTHEYLSLYHIVNAVDIVPEENGLVEIQVAAHNGPRKDAERALGDMYNQVFTDKERCCLRSVRVGNSGQVDIQDIGPNDSSAFELPTIHPQFVGKSHRYVFTNAAYPSTVELTNCVERLDLKTNQVDRAYFGPDRFAGEPLVVPIKTKKEETHAYILTFVYDSTDHATDCVILDAANLSAEPIATIRMPSQVPYGFHGTWTDDTFM